MTISQKNTGVQKIAPETYGESHEVSHSESYNPAMGLKMQNPTLKSLYAAGQSIWSDSLGREQLLDGTLARLVEAGITGVTSNPVIFEQAILGSNRSGSQAVYDADMAKLVQDKRATPMNIYESLAIADIQAACDLLAPVYEATHCYDGFVSFEVSPDLAHRTRVSMDEAKRLASSIHRPNLMIKIPATRAGMDVIRLLTTQGLNINVTLIFDRATLALVNDAYMSGLEARANLGKPLDQIGSVASFFISRIDSLVDQVLEGMLADPVNNRSKIASLFGQVAISNAKLAYQDHLARLASPRWQALVERGARQQRLLWASTGTKNPDYPKLHYVETLIGQDTVNTIPPTTLSHLMEAGLPPQPMVDSAGRARQRLAEDIPAAQKNMKTLKELGIDFDLMAVKLSNDGIKIFVDAAERLFKAIAQKMN